jgi:hypothetical protein
VPLPGEDVWLRHARVALMATEVDCSARDVLMVTRGVLLLVVAISFLECARKFENLLVFSCWVGSGPQRQARMLLECPGYVFGCRFAQRSRTGAAFYIDGRHCEWRTTQCSRTKSFVGREGFCESTKSLISEMLR